MPRHPEWIEDLYTRLANEEDARVCKAIDDKACREVPGNFFLILISNTLTKIGDRLSSPKTTLAWLLQALGAPSFFTGIIVPLRESGSLIPQLLIAGFIRSLPLRKWVWVTGSSLQGAAIAGMGLTALYLRGAQAGWVLTGLLAAFSLARGLCSIASKDVLGKTIPKTRRGRLKGLIGSLSGFITIVAGAVMIQQAYGGVNGKSVVLFGWILFAAALLWATAAFTYSLIREFPGETAGGGNAIRQALDQMKLLKTDSPLRRFVIVRALAIGSGLSAPFIIALAHERLDGAAVWLGVFIVANGISAMLASPLLGRWADGDSRSLLRSSMMAAFLLLAVVIILEQFSLPDLFNQIIFPTLFFILGIIHSGVRLGRKTYLVDMAEGDKRTTYVAVSNSLIGVILLVMGAFTGLLSLLSVEAALLIFALFALCGWWIGRQLPDVSG